MGQVSDQAHQVFDEEVVLITGAARRMGAMLARQFHAAGARVVIHYRQSQDAARALASELEDQRPRSVHLVRQPLGDQRSAQHLIMHTIRAWGRLDVLVNNVSTCLPTPLVSLVEAEVTSLLTSNFLAPLYVSQAAVPYLQQHEGCIVNLIDIHARQVLADHSVYCASRAALSMLTQTLAVDLAPLVRVNGVESGRSRGKKMPSRSTRMVQPIGPLASRWQGMTRPGRESRR